MLIHDYAAFTIWKTRNRELERKLELQRLAENGAARAARPYSLLSFLRALKRK
ncbi:hypothetical protein [Cohnella zeiphila]|uniref:Uncharacterized protein n=1 Tax=Cohnella zeiphila TaxID=2761120 RepID=A0A7X0VW16_9BACL|nr:hypothetical protein [Cohnella zeiphila]MBB6731962.1 hypothetical protein [Cohnella zeiphila]